VQFSEFQTPRDLDLNLESGQTAYHHISLIDLYVHTKFHWKRTNFLWTNVRTDGRTYGWTDISPSNVIRSTRRSRPNNTLSPTQRCLLLSCLLLWSPYVIEQTIIFLPCDFYLLSIFFFFLA